MRLNRFSPLLLTVTLCFVMTAMPRALAHPHAWIDLESTAILNDDGHLIALQQYWLFGDFYSSYVLADIGSDDRDAIIDSLREVARQNLVSLRDYDYFTVIKSDGQRKDIVDVEIFETGVVEGRIYLKFTTALAEPLDPATAVVRYAVYDPTYYIEILYAEGVAPRFQAPGAVVCELGVNKPSPTFDELAFAASLDRTENGGDGLGEVFAEWVEMTCH
ncbi:MAG: DUF1007 family protein [Rhodospirillales bacterium]